MTVTAVTHLNFRGEARAALEFYASVFDGDLVVVTNADGHRVTEPPRPDEVMWGQVSAANGFTVMAYDVPPAVAYDRGEIPFFLSLRGDSADEISALWERLVVGATVKEPLAPSPWTPLYGMLTDRFGVTWVLDVAVAYAG